jgi:hypothetical protein
MVAAQVIEKKAAQGAMDAILGARVIEAGAARDAAARLRRGR